MGSQTSFPSTVDSNSGSVHTLTIPSSSATTSMENLGSQPDSPPDSPSITNDYSQTPHGSSISSIATTTFNSGESTSYRCYALTIKYMYYSICCVFIDKTYIYCTCMHFVLLIHSYCISESLLQTKIGLRWGQPCQ